MRNLTPQRLNQTRYANRREPKIVKRFFEVIYALKVRKDIRGKKTFTDRYGINRWNMNMLEQNLASDVFQAAWLGYLVKDYWVSAQ